MAGPAAQNGLLHSSALCPASPHGWLCHPQEGQANRVHACTRWRAARPSAGLLAPPLQPPASNWGKGATDKLLMLLTVVQPCARAALLQRPQCPRQQRRAAVAAALSEEQQGGRAQDVQQPAVAASSNGAEAEDDSRDFAVAMAKVRREPDGQTPRCVHMRALQQGCTCF